RRGEGQPGEEDPSGPLNAGQQGDQPGQGAQQSGSQQGGNQGGSQQGGNQGGAYAGGDIGRGGGYGPRGGFYDPNRSDVWGPYPYGFWRDPQRLEEARERLQAAGTDLLTLSNRLRSEGLTAEELDAIRRLGEALRAGLTGNEALIERELRSLVNLIDHTELELRASSGDRNAASVRTEAPVRAARGYEDAVAEYYRRLSKAGGDSDSR